jgi:hypothetical protein
LFINKIILTDVRVLDVTEGRTLTVRFTQDRPGQLLQFMKRKPILPCTSRDGGGKVKSTRGDRRKPKPAGERLNRYLNLLRKNLETVAVTSCTLIIGFIFV